MIWSGTCFGASVNMFTEFVQGFFGKLVDNSVPIVAVKTLPNKGERE